MGGLDVKENKISLSPTAHAIISLLQCEFYGRPCFHRRQREFLPPELSELGEKWVLINASLAGKIGGKVSADKGVFDLNSPNSVKTFDTLSAAGKKGGAKTRDSGKLRQASKKGGSVQGPRNKGMAWYHKVDENGVYTWKRSKTPLEGWIAGRG
jgi:hypothetical protein